MPAKRSLSDLLDAAIKTMGSTWRTALVTGGVLFVPAAWLLGEANARMFGSLAQFMSLAARPELIKPGPMLRMLASVYAWSFAGAGLLGLVAVFVRACVTVHTWHAVSGRSVTLRQIVQPLLGRPLLRLAGQRLLLMAISAVVMGGAMVPATIALAVAAALDALVVAFIAFGVLVAAGLGVVVWVSVRFAVALEALVIQDLGVEASLDESARVVKGNWWRVLGRTLLAGLIIGFASSLVSAPVVMFALLRAYVDFFQSLLQAPGDMVEQYANLFETLAGLGSRIALSTYLSSVLTTLTLPGFMTLLYLDLAARHEPVLPAEPPAAPQVAVP